MSDPHDELEGLIHERREGQARYYQMNALTQQEARLVREAWERRRIDRRNAARGSKRRKSD